MTKEKTGNVEFYVEPKITEIEIVRETDSSVWRKNGLRELKSTYWHVYHDSWKEAHDYLIRKAEQYIRGRRDKLKASEDELSEVLKMEAPRD